MAIIGLKKKKIAAIGVDCCYMGFYAPDSALYMLISCFMVEETPTKFGTAVAPFISNDKDAAHIMCMCVHWLHFVCSEH